MCRIRLVQFSFSFSFFIKNIRFVTEIKFPEAELLGKRGKLHTTQYKVIQEVTKIKSVEDVILMSTSFVVLNL